MQMIPSDGGPFDYRLSPLLESLFRRLTNEESARVNKISPNENIRNYRTECRTCSGVGSFTTRIESGLLVSCECSCRDQWMLGRVLLESGIGDAYQRYSWRHTTGVPLHVLQEIQAYMDNFDAYASVGMGLLLWSASGGTGKSLLSSLIVKSAMAKGHSAYFTTFADMINHHTASWSDADHRKWFVERIRFTKFLGIDDIGKENQNRSSVVDELLDMVIRTRIAHGLPTMITTNLNPVQDANIGSDFSRYQAGLLSLLAERTIVIDMTGGLDYRQTRKSELMRDALEGVRYPVVIK